MRRDQAVDRLTAGLKGGETVALDGAGFLRNGAAVNVKETAKTTASPVGEQKPQ